jgi:hypothetical protein
MFTKRPFKTGFHKNSRMAHTLAFLIETLLATPTLLAIPFAHMT